MLGTSTSHRPIRALGTTRERRIWKDAAEERQGCYVAGSFIETLQEKGGEGPQQMLLAEHPQMTLARYQGSTSD
jgi:hypothetical protein